VESGVLSSFAHRASVESAQALHSPTEESRLRQGATGGAALRGAQGQIFPCPGEIRDPACRAYALRELDEALDMNKPLYSAYYHKEELSEFWKQGSKAEGERYLRTGRPRHRNQE